MSEGEAIQLVAQYRRFSRQFSDQNATELQKMQKFHRHLFKNQDYSTFLERSLQLGLQTGEPDEILICAGYLAFLVNFQPEFAERMWEMCELYIQVLSGGVFYSHEVRRVYVMLSSSDYFEFLKEIIEKIEDLTQVSYVEGIGTNMDMIEKKLAWEIEVRKISKVKTNPRFLKFVDELVAFICKKEYAKNEDLLSRIIHLLRLVFEYLQGGMGTYKEKIIGLVEEWMAQHIYKIELKLDLFIVIKQCFESFGLSGFKLPLCYQFLQKNLASIHEIEYLELLSSFFSKFNKRMLVNQTETNKILRELSKAIWRRPNGRHQDLYKEKSMMIDQIRKISTLFYWDLNKYITSDLKQVNNRSLYAFMTSLMFIFDQRMSRDIVGKIEGEKRKYFESSLKNNEYETVLIRYCSDTIVEDYLNPELADDIIWDLLTIRATVIINYNALCEIQKVENLVINFIKFITLGVYPQECLEIIEKIIANDPHYDLRKLQRVSYANMLTEVLPLIATEAFASQAATYDRVVKMFANLEKIMVMITSKYKVADLKNFKLFQVIIKFANELPDSFISSTFMKNLTKLLFATVPLDFRQVYEPDLKDSLALLLANTRKTQSVADFQLYLQIMARASGQPALRSVFINKHEEVEHCIVNMNILELAENLEDIYKINFYIIQGGPFQDSILNGCWNIMMMIDTFHYTEFYSCILRLFQHFLECIRSQGGNGIKFIEFQLDSTEGLLVHIDELISRTITLKKIQQLLGAKSSILVYAQDLLMICYQQTNFQPTSVAKIHSYLLKSYQDMKKNRTYLTNFEQSPFRIREYWCSVQKIILMMIPEITKGGLCANTHMIMENTHELDERFEWLGMYNGKKEESAIRQASLDIAADLLELHEIAFSRFTQPN